MPLTTLDPVAALVSIDLQKGILGMPTVHPANEIVARTAKLARVFRENGLPVVLVNVAGPAPGRTDAGRPNITYSPDWADLAPELDPQPGDHRVTKHCWGAFLGTDLDNTLRKANVTQIFLAGVATSIGVESTARSAFDLGYNVVLLADAMTDRDPETHKFTLEKIFPRLGELTTTDDALKMLSVR
jgi:nicotinamidase-related amidase